MIVGVDARNLVGRIMGISRYVLEMSRNLVALGCDVRLYLPEPPHADVGTAAGAAMTVGAFRGAVARVIWGETELPRLAARDKVDVFWGPAHRLPAFLNSGVPRVLTVYDLVWVHAAQTMRLQTWLGERMLMDPAVRRADAVATISNATAEAIRRRYDNLRVPLVIIHPGTTRLELPDRSDILARHGIDRPYALFVGTLEPRKNLHRLVEAYMSLPEALRKRCMLAIAGGLGWRLDGDLFGARHRDAGIRLLGYVTESDLAFLYAGSRFLAMPSLYEGFGLPVIEANMFGVPALTSNISSMPEVGGEAAHLVDPLDIDSIASGLSRLIVDDDYHAALAARAVENAKRFNWRRSAERLLALFNDLHPEIRSA